MKKAVALFWSGGKDAALTLHKLQQSNTYEPKVLICTINSELKKVAMHGVPERLIELQAKSIGLPLLKMYLPADSGNDSYESLFLNCLEDVKSIGIKHVAFGDIFLEDLRAYREDLMEKANMVAVFPIWDKDSTKIINEYLSLGFKSITCSVDSKLLSDDYLGIEINDEFVNNLPEGVDSCG
ncbi:MAG: ATP-binding protein, partial [Flavobacterium sp.]|nr:ATP-binding protein [Flavobacterium sp.]